MGLTADQKLRKELLLFSLGKQPDLEAAIEMAAAMERYVLCGQQSSAAETGVGLAAIRPNGSDRPTGSIEATGDEGGAGAAHDAAVPVTNRKRRWSGSDDRRLEQLWRSERTLEDIARELDRTVPSLYSRGRALGLSKRDHLVHSRQPRACQPDKVSQRTASTSHCNEHDLPTLARSSARFKTARQKASADGPNGKGGGTHSHARKKAARSAGALVSRGSPPEESQIFVDSIVHFLRSRDYSVVRVDEGRFRLDGRRVVTVDELLDKANQLRKSLGQPLFELSYNQ